jgi:hypothetical protein
VAYLVILESGMVKLKWSDDFGIPLTFSVLVKSLSRSLLKSLWVGFITFTNFLFLLFSIYAFRVGLNYNTDLKFTKICKNYSGFSLVCITQSQKLRLKMITVFSVQKY